MPASTAVRHPLVVTADPDLLDELLRLAQLGRSPVHVAPDGVAARDAWAGAPFVLVGADAVEDCLRAGVGPRAAVVIVARTVPDRLPWRMVEALRVEQLALLPAAAGWLVERFADQADGRPDRGRVVAVLGSRRGVGASTLATALAVSARRRGLDTLLVDADPDGRGVDLVLGWERMAELRWPDLVDPQGRVNPPALVGRWPGAGSLAVLAPDRSTVDGVSPAALAAVLDAGRRGRDLIVLDLSRRSDDATLLGLTAADRAYLLVPADVRSCAGARSVAAAAGRHCPTLSLVVRGPIGGGIRPSELAEALALPLSGVLPPDPRVGAAGPPGVTGRGPLAELCRDLLAGIRPRRSAGRVGAR